MKNLLEVIPSRLEKISFPDGEFMVVPEALSDRHKDFWKLYKDNWEKENLRAVSNFIDSNTTVIDLGAWVGPMTLYSAALGAKHVYAFEPDIRAHEFLQKNIAVNPKLQKNITLSKEAIAKIDGEIMLGPLSGRPLGDSTTSTEGTNLTPVTAISVNTLRKECQIDTAKKLCIKIDIEGSEKYVLEDVVNMLTSTNKPFLLIIEIHPFHLSTEDSKKVENCIKKLISISSNFVFKQRRRVGEVKKYPDIETEWKSELYHPNGLFDMTFQRK